MTIKKDFPGLFCKQGIIQEYALISGTQSAYKEVIANVQTAVALVEVARSDLSQKCTEISSKNKQTKHATTVDILNSLSTSLSDIEDDESKKRHKIVAGLLLLPTLLGEDMDLFIRQHEVIHN